MPLFEDPAAEEGVKAASGHHSGVEHRIGAFVEEVVESYGVPVGGAESQSIGERGEGH